MLLSTHDHLNLNFHDLLILLQVQSICVNFKVCAENI